MKINEYSQPAAFTAGVSTGDKLGNKITEGNDGGVLSEHTWGGGRVEEAGGGFKITLNHRAAGDSFGNPVIFSRALNELSSLEVRFARARARLIPSILSPFLHPIPLSLSLSVAKDPKALLGPS